MKTLGIIAEYNPFHNGHLYHIEKSKKESDADCVVAVMSGNFLQRGELALMDKWARAEAAIRCGVDLVVELPYVFACNSAEYFARGAIRILEGLGCVDAISFGSENGDLDKLRELASFLCGAKDEVQFLTFNKKIREYLENGNSYAVARSLTVRDLLGSEASALLDEPNNILAVEYLKQIISIGSSIVPITVKRYGTGYHQEDTFENIASASAIRKILNEGQDVKKFIPNESVNLLSLNQKQDNDELLHKLIVYKVLGSTESEIKEIFAMKEGLENKLKKAVRKSKGMEQLADGIKSKRYTRTSINRLLINSLIGLKEGDVEEILKENISYARILGMSVKGRELLSKIKKNELSSIPVITNINKEIGEGDNINKLLKYDILAGDIYNMILGREIYGFSDFVKKPYVQLV